MREKLSGVDVDNVSASNLWDMEGSLRQASGRKGKAMVMNIPQPMTQKDMDELDDFLLSEQTPEECMDISMLDGLFTCLLVCPETIPPSQWLPVVWGLADGEDMVWESQQQAQHIYGLLMAYYNRISAAFQYDPPRFEPLFYENRQGDPILDEWCMGFMKGMELSPGKWNEMLNDINAAPLLAPMILFGTEVGWKLQEKDREEFERVSQKEWAERIEQAVPAIHAYWLPHRQSQIASMPQASRNNIGRNDPCPCGSGKKFKLCCMN